MIETSLNIFDAAVFVVMGLSCALAFFRGFVREVLSLSAWVMAGVVTLYFFPQLAEKLQPKFKSAVVAAGFSTLGIYIIALIGFSLLNSAILKFIKSGTDVGLLDNWLGFFFGVLRGGFLISLGFFLMTIVLPEDDYPDAIKQARTLPYVERGALVVANISPKYLRDISSLKQRAEDARSKGSGGIGKIGNPFAPKPEYPEKSDKKDEE